VNLIKEAEREEYPPAYAKKHPQKTTSKIKAAKNKYQSIKGAAL
jgi:hypothetical protein